MYNKIELKNNGAPFTVMFDGTTYNVPTWLFEAEQTLGNFIKSQANKWKLDVTIASRAQAPTVKKIEEDKIVSVETPVEEPVIEDEVKTTKTKK